MKIRSGFLLLALVALASCQLLTQDLPNKPATVPATGLTLKTAGTPVAASVGLVLGTSQTFTAAVVPANTTDMVVWSSSDAARVSVTQAGAVTLNSALSGTVTVTAAAGAVQASFAVTQVIPATSLALYASTAGSTFTAQNLLGASDTFVRSAGTSLWVGALVQPSGTTDSIVWTSSDPSTVSITDQAPAAPAASFGAGPRTLVAPSSVTVTALKSINVLKALTQDVTITATAGSVSASFQLLVPKPATSLELFQVANDGSLTPAVTTSTQAYGLDYSPTSDSAITCQVQITPADSTDTVVWLSTDTSVVSIDAPTSPATGASRATLHVVGDYHKGRRVIVTVTAGAQTVEFSLQPSNG